MSNAKQSARAKRAQRLAQQRRRRQINMVLTAIGAIIIGPERLFGLIALSLLRMLFCRNPQNYLLARMVSHGVRSTLPF